MTNPISVRGGAAGIEAQCAELNGLARRFGAAGLDTGAQALALHGYLVHPALLAAATFDPIGSARFTAELAAALDGPSGVSQLALRCGITDAALRAAALAYLGVDRLETDATPSVEALTGLPVAVTAASATVVTGGGGKKAGQRLLTSDPALLDVGLDVVAGGLLHTDVASAAGLVGRGYADGHPVVHALGTDQGADIGGAPSSLTDVVAGLARRDQGPGGSIDVRLLDGAPDGRRRVIVDITGTKNWDLGRHNADITSPATNLDALAGQPTSYERGVVAAMRQAGVGPGDEVMLVGHSQGGLVAVDLANHVARSGEFHVTHVVSLGAPVGELTSRTPKQTAVLAVENLGDVIPHLDAAENPDRTNVTTVEVQRGPGSTVGDRHPLTRAYLPGAADIDASRDPSVCAYLGGLDGFFAARTVRTSTFQITRAY